MHASSSGRSTKHAWPTSRDPDSWIAAQYLSMTDALITYGPEENY